MQQQQSTDLQNGTITTGGGGGGGGGTGGNITTQNSPPGSFGTTAKRSQISGGRFDFEDGGTYCGGWEEGKAHGFGVCTGPKHQGAYAGAWNYGFEVSGVYIWPSGSSFEGQWQNGRRHGLGVEQRGRLIYRGEWACGHKGRYGVRQSTTSTAKYEGTWANGLQDGYGSETYADGGHYQGQWQEGKRHGYGVRTSAPFGLASHTRPKHIHTSLSSLNGENADPGDKRNHHMDDVRGGFVLRAKSDDEPARRNSLTDKSKKGIFSGLKMRKQKSTGDLEKRGTVASGSIRSTVSTASWISTGSSQSVMSQKSIHTESNASFTIDEEQLDPNVVETYIGEWKRDKRDGYGISERSDGLKYEGEWHNNKKHGYGVTTFRDGTVEEGKYKSNILITSQKKKHLFLIRSRKFRERIEASIQSAQRASKYALQKGDIAISRSATARSKAEYADSAADHARIDCENAVSTAREFAPDFKPSVLERFERLRYRERFRPPIDENSKTTTLTGNKINSPNSGGSGINQIMGNKIIDQQSLAFQQQQQSAMNRRASQAVNIKFTKQQSVEYPVPSSMYSQQMVPPQTDLSQHVSKIQLEHQQQQQQQQQQHLLHNNPPPPSSLHQQNPSYHHPQQQQSDIGVTSNYIGSGGGIGGNQQPSQHLQTNSSQSYGWQLNSGIRQSTQDIRNQMYSDNGGGVSSGGGISGNQMWDSNKQQQQQQIDHSQLMSSGPSGMRRNSRPANESHKAPILGNKAPMLGNIGQQSSIDHFDHYKRPPSRDNSVDRYARAASRMSGIPGGASRQPSVDRGLPPQPQTLNSPTISTGDTLTGDRNIRAGSVFRGTTPIPTSMTTGNGSIPTGMGAASRSGTPSYQVRQSSEAPVFSSPNQPFEDVLLRQRTLGQDIIPSPSQPKRTESLFVPPKLIAPSGGGGAGGIAGKTKLKSVPINVTLQRKKSLPDFQACGANTEMSREEVSALGSARREEVRRQIENNERLKANPLLYLVSPQVKDWFSRQQLVLLVLIVNVVLAIMFIKMLT